MAKYKEAETYLKDYLTGRLQRERAHRKFKLVYPDRDKEIGRDLRNEAPDPKAETGRRKDRLEAEIIKYADDGTYVFLQTKIETIEKYLESLRKSDKVSYRILLLYYYHRQSWMEVADAVFLSESQCRRKRRCSIIELQRWLK